jgi:pimeloyl-ACP methyl ester carboxylesterase
MDTRLSLLAMACLVGSTLACATPVGVKRVDARAVHRSLTTNVLSHGKPSAPTAQTLHRLALYERFDDDPEAALAELHAGLPEAGAEGVLFALAELSFLHAEHSGKRPYYLAAALYAYAFLFPEADAVPDPFDPRLRLATDLYNRGITAGLTSGDGSEVILAAGVLSLPFGELDLQVDPSGFTWGGRRLVRFVPVAELDVRGLRNRYRRAGIGAPLAASIDAREPGAKPPPSIRIPRNIKVPVTAFVRFEQPRRGISAGRVEGSIELYAEDISPSVRVGNVDVPLEYEPSSSLAYSLARAEIWEFELKGFLSGDFRKVQDGLYMLHPYRKGRVPVVLVHGTASSPGRWAEMLNELGNDPSLEDRYQFWLFMYNTGNPILYSASLLRESLRGALTQLDPKDRDPALRRMTLIGHSQGGLLARLMVVDSETRFWDAVSRVPLDQLEISEESHDLLQRAMFFEALAFVERVIFIATPHRGSFLAGRRLGRLAAGLVTLPNTLRRTGREFFGQNPDAAVRRSVEDVQTSVDNMDPKSVFVQALSETEIADGVAVHSIIPVQGSGPPAELDDGVVEYVSAHLEHAASELVVRSGHSTQSHPHTIEETRRILNEHLETR